MSKGPIKVEKRVVNQEETLQEDQSHDSCFRVLLLNKHKVRMLSGHFHILGRNQWIDTHFFS